MRFKNAPKSNLAKGQVNGEGRAAQFPGTTDLSWARAKRGSEPWGIFLRKMEALTDQGENGVHGSGGGLRGGMWRVTGTRSLGSGCCICFPRNHVQPSKLCPCVLNTLESWIWLEYVTNCWVWSSIWLPRELTLSKQVCLIWDIQWPCSPQLFLTLQWREPNSHWLKTKKNRTCLNLDLESPGDGFQVQLDSRSSNDLIRFWIISFHLLSLSFSGLSRSLLMTIRRFSRSFRFASCLPSHPSGEMTYFNKQLW